MISNFYKHMIVGLFRLRLRFLSKEQLKTQEYRLLGDLYSVLDMNDKAVCNYYNFINKNLADKDIIKSLGRALSNLKEYDKVINLYKNADNNIIDCEILYHWGKICAKQGNYNEALKKFSESYKLNSNCYYSLFSSANVLEEMGLYKESIEKYEQALKISPKNTDILIGMGLAYDSMGAYKKATRIFQKAIAIEPKKPEAYFAWGTVLEKMKDFNGAKAKYALAIKYDPMYSDVYCRWGEVLFIEQQYKEAIAKFTKAVHINKDNTMAIYNIACTYSKLNDNAKAMKYLKLLLSIDKSFVDDIVENPNLRLIVEDKRMISFLAV